MEDYSLPFPESVACSEIVKAGQGGATGAKFVFGMIGVAAVLELLKNMPAVAAAGDNQLNVNEERSFTIHVKGLGDRDEVTTPPVVHVYKDGMQQWEIRPKQLKPLAEQAVNALNLFRRKRLLILPGASRRGVR